MDTSLSEECVQIEADPSLTMLEDELTPEEEGGTEISDEVEDLSNSLREAVHDLTIKPKLQCLMMDPSFSMVTVQTEDSGIQWETTPSRSSTPWVSEGRSSSLEPSSSAMERSVTPGSGAAGRIIFIMDEEKIIRRKRSRESTPGRRSRADRETPVIDAEDGVAARPELVGVSLPNVKGEGEAEEEDATDPKEEKKQRLFRLVSEGSEILNIVVPPKLVSVDEEESKAMQDNLSFLEETPVSKPTNIDSEEVFEACFGVTVEEQARTDPGGDQDLAPPVGSHLARPDGTDPPGAPVARAAKAEAEINTDYFETFTLVDAQAAPGAPAAVILEGQEETGGGSGGENQAGEEQNQPRETSAAVTRRQSSAVAISGEEIVSDHLDEVFYGGTDDMSSTLGGEEDGKLDKSVLPKSPLKKSGSSLFGSQEDVLTPIFLPPGPPKIIDPSLLDEPKALAFLYTDLYEEAVGSREKEEDAASLTSERSFHSRHSDREARGYLEKFVLKDDTPVVDMEPDEERRLKEERLQKWTENAQKLLSKPQKEETQGDVPEVPEEIATELTEEKVEASETDLAQTVEETGLSQVDASGESPRMEDETQPDEPLKPESSAQEAGKASVPEDLEIPAVPEKCVAPGEEGKALPTEIQQQPSSQIDSDVTNQKPLKLVAPPRRRRTIALKATLDLTPLCPVETVEEGEDVKGKEQREEEKEKASPAETADEGEGDGDETEKVDVSSPPALSQDALLPMADNENAAQVQVTEPSETEPVKDEERDQETVNQDTASTQAEEEKVEVAEAEVAEAEVATVEAEVAEVAEAAVNEAAVTEAAVAEAAVAEVAVVEAEVVEAAVAEAAVAEAAVAEAAVAEAAVAEAEVAEAEVAEAAVAEVATVEVTEATVAEVAEVAEAAVAEVAEVAEAAVAEVAEVAEAAVAEVAEVAEAAVAEVAEVEVAEAEVATAEVAEVAEVATVEVAEAEVATVDVAEAEVAEVATVEVAEAEVATVEVAEAEGQKEETCDREPAEGDTRFETVESESSESAETEVEPEKGGASITESAETDSGNSPIAVKAVPDEQHGRCIIL